MRVAFVGFVPPICADPLSSLLSERRMWRNPVVAEGIVPSFLRILRFRVPMLPTFTSAHKRLSRLDVCAGLSPYSSRLTNLCTCEVCVRVWPWRVSLQCTVYSGTRQLPQEILMG